jgi:hypothetical protein
VDFFDTTLLVEEHCLMLAELRRRCIATSILLLGTFSSIGCGRAEIGEECDGIGSTDDCDEGAICTNEEGRGICRLLCTETVQCPAAHTCNGISGTNFKSCQPDRPK